MWASPPSAYRRSPWYQMLSDTAWETQRCRCGLWSAKHSRIVQRNLGNSALLLWVFDLPTTAEFGQWCFPWQKLKLSSMHLPCLYRSIAARHFAGNEGQWFCVNPESPCCFHNIHLQRCITRVALAERAGLVVWCHGMEDENSALASTKLTCKIYSLLCDLPVPCNRSSFDLVPLCV